MDTVKILIFEDDPIIAADIEATLIRAGYEVLEILEKGEYALNALEKHSPDLILMDVQLEGETDGIQTADLISQKHSLPIIFLTANADRDTFNRAKETNPYAFITKPFDAFDLERGIELAIQKFQEFQQEKEGETNTEDAVILSDRIFLKDKNRMVKVFIKDIFYIMAQGNYCDIFTKEKKFTVTSNLKNFEAKLDDKFFVRVHRSYLINLNHLDGIGDAYLHIQKAKIPLALSYRSAFFEKLKVF